MYLEYSKGKWSLILLQKEENNNFYSKCTHSNATLKACSLNFQFGFYFKVLGEEQPDYNKSYSKASLGSSLSPIDPSAILTLSRSRIPEVRHRSELTTFQYQLQSSTDSSSASQALPLGTLVIYSQWFY